LTEMPLFAGVLKNDRSISERVELTRFFCSAERESRSDVRFEVREVGWGESEPGDGSSAACASARSTDSSIVLAKNGDAVGADPMETGEPRAEDSEADGCA
jgi:hypothetical protein